MSLSRHPNIRALLRASEDGMTAAQIGEAMGVDQGGVYHALVRMPDAYIDRYLLPVRGQYAAVWCVVVPPENCPHPRRHA